jgi:hypothetical protein
MLPQMKLNLLRHKRNIYFAIEPILLQLNSVLKMRNVGGTVLRSSLEIILASSVHEILSVSLSDTGNEKYNIFNII